LRRQSLGRRLLPKIQQGLVPLRGRHGFAQLIVLALQQLKVPMKLAVLFVNTLQGKIRIPGFRNAVIDGRKRGERNAEDLTKRSADILKQPLALTRKKEEGDEQAGEQHYGKTSSAVC
ncbi:MAG: hypothetical protein JNM35_07215, partial [Nitrospira sp.]|nr:hypothetical protein [Nitrospira sp.]